MFCVFLFFSERREQLLKHAEEAMLDKKQGVPEHMKVVESFMFAFCSAVTLMGFLVFVMYGVQYIIARN